MILTIFKLHILADFSMQQKLHLDYSVNLLM